MASELQGCIFCFIFLPKLKKQGKVQPGVFLVCPPVVYMHVQYPVCVCSLSLLFIEKFPGKLEFFAQ